MRVFIKVLLVSCGRFNTVVVTPLSWTKWLCIWFAGFMFSKEEERTSFLERRFREGTFRTLREGGLEIAATADNVGEVLVTACEYSLAVLATSAASISLAVTRGQSCFVDWEIFMAGGV